MGAVLWSHQGSREPAHSPRTSCEMSTVILLQRKNGTASVPYKLLPPEAVFANILGLLIILFVVLVLCALANPSWKRPEADF